MSINKLQIYNKEYNIVTPEEIDEVKEDVSGAVSTANAAKQESVEALNKANNSVSNLHSTITTVGIGWHELFSSSGAQISGILQIAATSAQEDHTSLTLSFNVENNSGGQVQASSSQIGYVSASEPFNRFATYYDKDKGKWRFFIELKTENRLSVSYNLHNLVGSTGISYVNQFVSSIPTAAQDFLLIKGAGIIADRTTADYQGNVFPNSYCMQKFGGFTANQQTWYRVAVFNNLRCCCLATIENRWQNSYPARTILLLEQSWFSQSNIKQKIIQISSETNAHAVIIHKVRLVTDVANEESSRIYLDVLYGTPSENSVLTTITNLDKDTNSFHVFNKEEVIVNPLILDTQQATEYEINYDMQGIIADKAMNIDPSVFTQHQVIKRYNVSTNDELDAAINDVYADVPEYSFFEFCISVKVSNIDLHGGTWYFKGFKGDINYGYIEGEIYRNYDEKARRVKIQGTWSNFYKDSFSIRRITNHMHATISGEVEAFLNNCHVEAGDRTTYEASFGIGVAGIFELGGGSWYVRGYRPNESYGYQEIKKYADSGIFYYARSLNNGVWTPWKNMIPT